MNDSASVLLRNVVQELLNELVKKEVLTKKEVVEIIREAEIKTNGGY
jgi:hypothetical protein